MTGPAKKIESTYSPNSYYFDELPKKNPKTEKLSLSILSSSPMAITPPSPHTMKKFFGLNDPYKSPEYSLACSSSSTDEMSLTSPLSYSYEEHEEFYHTPKPVEQDLLNWPETEDLFSSEESSDSEEADEKIPQLTNLSRDSIESVLATINYNQLDQFISAPGAPIFPDQLFLRKKFPTVLSHSLRVTTTGKILILPKSSEYFIGSGTAKKVYLAVDLKSRKAFANSVISHNRKSEIADNLREIKIQRKFKGNDNIAQIKSKWIYKNSKGIKKLSVLAPLYEGSMLNKNDQIRVDLKNYLHKDPADKKNFIKGIILGLQAIHQQNYLHRDIKPANILLEKTPEGKIIPKIGDFGLSQKSSAAKAENIAGSIWYLAPENHNSHKTPPNKLSPQSEKSDIYAAGIVIGEVIGYLTSDELVGHYMRNSEEPKEPLANTYEHLVWSMTRKDPQMRITLQETLIRLEQL